MAKRPTARKVEPQSYRLDANPYLVRSLDINTCHLTAKDAQLLDEASNGGVFTDPLESPNNNPVVAYKYEYGHFVFCDTDPDDFPTMVKYGYSQQFVRVLQRAKDVGCKYVQFDCDGIQYDDLDTFSW